MITEHCGAEDKTIPCASITQEHLPLTTTTPQHTYAQTHASLQWRPMDIAVSSAIGVACGLVFWGFNYISAWLFPMMAAILPGLGSLFHAVWYFSGPLALLIIRKPGAAIFVNLVGSAVEMLLGNQFSFGFVFLSGALQGLFAEIAFAIFLYRRWTLSIAILSGFLVAVEYGFYLLFFQYQGVALISARGIIHMICEIIGGVLIGGVMSWYLYLAIAKTGALDKFASGRAVRGISD
jgi:energy-coupling factor transport system substrate-specific component